MKGASRFSLLTVAVLLAAAWPWAPAAGRGAPSGGPQSKIIQGGANVQIATFGAGCFWGVEEEFRSLPGVLKTTVGYSGGTMKNPTYTDVCTGNTGHAEAVEIAFDPARISYEQLLAVFWKSHDPTTLDRQGPDYGHQYRSVIFTHTPEQKTAAEKSRAQLEKSGEFSRPIVTEIVPAGPFYRAEEYHQQYLLKNGRASCVRH